MTRVTMEQLIALVEGDRELVVVLLEHGIIEEHSEGFCAADVDRVLASRTLVRELEVNPPGVDIILRLREELAAARSRLEALERASKSSEDGDE